MEDLLAEIDQQLPPSQSRDVYQTLSKVFGNILKSPSEPKFRTLKKDNKIVSEKIGRSTAAISLMLSLGFDDTGATYTLPASVDLVDMQNAADLIECIMASLPGEPAAPALAAGATIVGGVIQRPLSAGKPTPQSAGAKDPRNFARRAEGVEAQWGANAQLAEVRAARAGIAAPAAPSTATQAEKKPIKSAFDFKSRSAEAAKQEAATNSLQEMRKQQKDKYKDFQADPSKAQTEAYQQPASVAPGGTTDSSWSSWFGFGSGSSSQSKPERNERQGPRIKTIGDLPKPPPRGGG